MKADPSSCPPCKEMSFPVEIFPPHCPLGALSVFRCWTKFWCILFASFSSFCTTVSLFHAYSVCHPFVFDLNCHTFFPTLNDLCRHTCLEFRDEAKLTSCIPTLISADRNIILMNWGDPPGSKGRSLHVVGRCVYYWQIFAYDFRLLLVLTPVVVIVHCIWKSPLLL